MQCPLLLAFSVIFHALLSLSPIMVEQAHAAKNSNYTIAKAIDAKLIANFPLDENFLTKIENVRKDMANLPIEEEVADGDNDITIRGLTKAVEARPRLIAILEKHQMTANDYVIGAMALANVLAALIEEDASDLTVEHKISIDNMAFGKKYLARIRALYGP